MGNQTNQLSVFMDASNKNEKKITAAVDELLKSVKNDSESLKLSLEQSKKL